MHQERCSNVRHAHRAEEEKAADEKLTGIAESKVNRKAASETIRDDVEAPASPALLAFARSPHAKRAAGEGRDGRSETNRDCSGAGLFL